MRRRRWRRHSVAARNAIVGPLPDSQPHHAPADTPASSAPGASGTAARRAAWCSRSSVAPASIEGSSCSIAATNCATRPRLWTTSARAISPASAPRERSVDVVVSGTHTTTVAAASTGPTRSGITAPSTHATTPPATDAAALSPWRSRPTATSRMAVRSAASAAVRSSTPRPSPAPRRRHVPPR